MIPVRNVYQMLSYAIDLMDEPTYRDFNAEPFDNAADLCAAILCRGVEAQVKRGLSATTGQSGRRWRRSADASTCRSRCIPG